MTSEQTGSGKTPEIQRARAELVEALTALEDKVNLPKRFKRFRAEKPGTVKAAVGGAGALVAGIVALVVVGAVRRK